MCLHNTGITLHLQKNYETEEKPNPRRTGIYMEEWGGEVVTEKESYFFPKWQHKKNSRNMSVGM